MSKKFLLSIAFFTIIVLLAGCGGSGGTTGIPKGVNPGIPSIVQLLAVQAVAQTNSYLYFKAKVLDGNGNPVKNEPVTFTNLSLLGTLQPLGVTANGVGISAGGPVVVNTDSLGFATITLYSTTSGFATVQSEVNTGAGMVRDKKTVYFTAGSLNLLPFMTLDVDGDGDTNWNETGTPGDGDFIFFETTSDDTVQVRATVYDTLGLLEPFSLVTFGADVPYRIGDPDATCSDGSDVCEVFFMFGNKATTGPNGEGASVFVQVTSPVLRNIQTLFNVTASADNGAANLVTLFVQPVIVALVTVSANPVTVECGGDSTITARVTTSAGTIVPDGTSVSFTVDIGSIEPFAQTTDGIAEVKYTAPDCDPGDPDQVATITATVAGVSGTTTVTVTAEPLDPVALRVVPAQQLADNVLGETVTFTIYDGVPPYSVFQVSGPVFPPSTATVATSGGSFDVFIPAGTPTDVAIYDIYDDDGTSVTATLNIGDDTTGPSVVSTVPVDTAIGVGDPTIVTITWDEAVDCSTVSTTSVTVSPVPGTSWGLTGAGCTTNVAEFTLDNGGAGGPFTVTVTTAVTDLVGNPMSADYVFTFTQ